METGRSGVPIISIGGDLLAAGDINGDGKIDIVVQNKPTNILQSPQDYVQFGNGDGTFQTMTNPLPFLGPVALHDINGDGKLDLVIQNTYPVGGAPFVSVFLGLGNGNFTHLHHYLLDLDGSNSRNIVIADFNNDGLADIAMNSTLLLGENNLTFAAAPALAFSNDIYGVVVGDFNKDGNPDMAVQTATDLTIALGNGNGAFIPAHNYRVPQPVVSFATADLNSDGNLDLVGVVTASSPLAAWNIISELGAGDGSFRSPVLSPGSSGVPDPGNIVLGDFNGDGKSDLVITETPQSGPGSLLVLFGNGDGTFARPVVAGSNPGFIISGDFNADGKLDLAAASATGIGILLGNGDGTFQPTRMVSSTAAQRLVAGDVNLDGKLDLIATGAQTLVFLGNGDGTFHAAPPLNVSGVTLIGDINGDGSPDLVLSRPPQSGPGTREIDVLPGNSDGTFGSPIALITSRFALVPLAIADFNRDSLQDVALSLSPYLAIVEFPFGGVFNLLNTTPQDFTATLSSTVISITAPGQSATTTVTIRSMAEFAGTVSLTCSISPSSAVGSPTCSLSPATVSIGPTRHSATVTMTINTSAGAMSMAVTKRPFFLATFCFQSVGLVSVIFWSSKSRRLFPYATVLAIGLLMLSCGGQRSTDSPSSSSYSVTLRASSANLVHTATASLTVP